MGRGEGVHGQGTTFGYVFFAPPFFAFVVPVCTGADDDAFVPWLAFDISSADPYVFHHGSICQVLRSEDERPVCQRGCIQHVDEYLWEGGCVV